MKIFNDLEVVAIPTKTKFRGVTIREAVIFKGSQHWSEFSPFLEYSDEESNPGFKLRYLLHITLGPT